MRLERSAANGIGHLTLQAGLAAAGAVILLSALAAATLVEVEVATVLRGEVKNVSESVASGLYLATAELTNTGSVGYTARARLDLIRGQDIVATGWSSPAVLQPGERAAFTLGWAQPNASGTFMARRRFYFAQEILEVGATSLILAPAEQRDAFSISGVRTYDDVIRFDLWASEPVEEVYVLPGSPPGWIVEQVLLPLGRSAEVRLPYTAEVFREQSLRIVIASADGALLHAENIPLRREEGASRFVGILLDTLMRAWHGLF
ncbi:MAG: hypothetical protein HY520_05165 [Candidatus Aenigmarchaeota archaeon]|nr:hypothetical protein [Candidatus Aenigmarchaeota archaeon]